MTDFERTKQFLDSLGISYSTDSGNITFGNNQYNDGEFPLCNKVDGYSGFYTRFEFDESGNFLTVGAWE